MTEQEALEWFKDRKKMNLDDKCQQAEDMAIKALEQEKTGHWIEEPNCWVRCSCCGEHYPRLSTYGFIGSNYCGNCGAKMVKPQESEG